MAPSKLADRRLLVVGASRGAGRAIAVELAAQGAAVGLVARDRAALGALADELRARGSRVAVAAADVRDEGQVELAVQATARALGGLDGLIYCAGVSIHGAVEGFALDDWRLIVDTNLTGLFLCVRAALPLLRAQRHGSIIALSSGAGKQGYAGLAAYCASKFGLMGFLQSLAAEVGDEGIKVSTLVPGSILTGFGGRSVAERAASGQKYLWPEDVAQAVIYLLTQSDRAWTQEMTLWPFASLQADPLRGER